MNLLPGAITEKEFLKHPERYRDKVIIGYCTISYRSGKLAEKLGAEDLKEGDVVEVDVKLKVRRHVKTMEKGKTQYDMTLCIVKAGEMVESESDEEDEEKKGKSLFWWSIRN
jgi:hypothetical protein